MAAWYIATWVNAPLPVMSPTAHSPSAARSRSSTAMAPGGLVEADRADAERREVGAAAGGDQQPLGGRLARRRRE